MTDMKSTARPRTAANHQVAVRRAIVPLHRSLLRRSVFTIFDAIEEHCVTEYGHAVAPENLAVTEHWTDGFQI